MTAGVTVRRQYKRPPLYPKQEAALFAPERYVWCEASTKAGKTLGCLVWVHERAALDGKPGREFWWVAPSHQQARIAYDRLTRMIPRGLFTKNDSTKAIKIANGAVIRFLSGEIPDNLYGEDVYAAVMDEASRMRFEAFVAVRSTLTATQGHVRIIGNVKGRRNWFYRGCRAAERGLPGHHWARINSYDAADAGVVRRSEIDDAQRVLPESEFRQLYLALPAEEGDAFFATDRIGYVDAYPPHALRARGWDFAATEEGDAADPDWTAGVLIAHTSDLTVVCDVVRARKAPDGTLLMLDKAATDDGPNVSVVIEQERGAAGKTMVSSIRRHLRELDGGRKVIDAPVTGDKATRAFPLAVQVNKGKVALLRAPWNDRFLAELDEFPGPDIHDDQVDAAAHAYNHLAGGPDRPRVRTLG